MSVKMGEKMDSAALMGSHRDGRDVRLDLTVERGRVRVLRSYQLGPGTWGNGHTFPLWTPAELERELHACGIGYRLRRVNDTDYYSIGEGQVILAVERRIIGFSFTLVTH